MSLVTPMGQARAAGRVVLFALAALVVIVGVVGVARFIVHPFGWGANAAATARADAKVAHQQADINQAGAEIGDRRATNTAQIRAVTKKATEDVRSSPDLDDALARYGDGIDRVRASGYAPLAGDPAADGGRSNPRPGSGAAAVSDEVAAAGAYRR